MNRETKLIKLKPSVHKELLDIASRREVAIGDVVEYLLDKWNQLRIFDNIPCVYCGKPLGNWKKNEIEKAFKGWYHIGCKLE